MPMIDVYAAAGTFASKHDLAQQLAAAAMRRGPGTPYRASPTMRKKEISYTRLNRLPHQDTGQKDQRPVGPVRRKRAARRVGDPPQPVARKPLHLRADVVASCRGASPR